MTLDPHAPPLRVVRWPCRPRSRLSRLLFGLSRLAQASLEPQPSAPRGPQPALGAARRRVGHPFSGFTLVEVLVALAITAIALVAGLKATAALSRNAERQGAVLLAQLCAENKLTELRLARQLPGVGEVTSDCAQAGRTLQVTQTVRPTPNPNFRRVDAAVSEGGVLIVRVVTIAGRN